MTSGPQPAQPLDADAPARVRLASGAVPPGDDRPGPAVALVRAALTIAELVGIDDELVAAAGLPGIVDRAPDSVLFSRGVRTEFADPLRPRA
ncbi:hypothetical protein [Clavibacter michiganensis]|uniref:hypothetical protein n=1 Tax=Clavibacter michiganensis TaxID=28447 RepID=UPI00292CE4D5|nr:hypothetical protein [Clavibacter michiganensis]